MIPAKYTCPPINGHESTMDGSWQNIMPIIDPLLNVNAQVAVGGHPNHNGAFFYHVEPRVGSMPACQ